MDLTVKFQDVLKANKNLCGKVTKTPLLHATILSDETESDTWLKLENLQLTGSFKVRGALNRISTLPNEVLEKGVVTASAGNHAQGVAYAAALRNISAKIVVPLKTPETKKDGIKRLGGELILFGNSYDEAEQHAREIALQTGRVFIPAFEDDYVIAGQGTATLEAFLEEPDFDAVIVPSGGGGLICGAALVAKAINPDIKVYGVQSVASAAWVNSFAAKELVPTINSETLAEGLAGGITQPNFDLAVTLVDDFRAVEEAEIAKAMQWFAEKYQLIVEGSGAVGVAALRSNVFPELVGKKVLIIVTGGNVDFSKLCALA